MIFFHVYVSLHKATLAIFLEIPKQKHVVVTYAALQTDGSFTSYEFHLNE